MIILVQVDYEAIDLLLQARKISRRQLAKMIGVSPDTLAGAFRRGSKMKVFQLWQIASILSVQPIDLLVSDKEGNYNSEDIEKVESAKFDFDFFATEDEIAEINTILEKLNPKALKIIKTIATEFSEIQEFKADYTVLHGDVISREGYLNPDELEE